MSDQKPTYDAWRITYQSAEQAARALWDELQRLKNSEPSDWSAGVIAGIEIGQHNAAVAAAPLQQTANWLADKICNGGDYAKEAAEMLRRWPAAAPIQSDSALDHAPWRHMRTVPKDGTAVLVLTPGSDIPKSVRWRNDCWEMTWDGHQLSEFDQPRYWMPCPTDPDQQPAVPQPVGEYLPLPNPYAYEFCAPGDPYAAPALDYATEHEAWIVHTGWDVKNDLYTGDQVRAYVDADRKARAQSAHNAELQDTLTRLDSKALAEWVDRGMALAENVAMHVQFDDPLRASKARDALRAHMFGRRPQPAGNAGELLSDAAIETLAKQYDCHSAPGFKGFAKEVARRTAPSAQAQGQEAASIHLADLKNALATATELRQQLRLMDEHSKGEVWRWQGDGGDYLASMGNRMGVLIYASDLRALLAAQGQESDATLLLENALSELIDKICDGLDSGDLLADARAASKALDAEPVLYVSKEQLEAHSDPDETDGQGGRYLPARKTPAGKFTQSLYAGQPPRTQADAEPVATVKENPYCPEGESDELSTYLPVGTKLYTRPPRAQTDPTPSPTAGMNLGERILHVGGRNNAQGYIEFGSPMAVYALIHGVLRDMSTPGQDGAFQARYRLQPDGVWSSWGAVLDQKPEGHDIELRFLPDGHPPRAQADALTDAEIDALYMQHAAPEWADETPGWHMGFDYRGFARALKSRKEGGAA
ncbi:hypothetical protein D8I35_09565 [Corticibacter populi]|uniref:Uncharacterized protein n=1 Tax=Corticibacter populi TaxID=1550736 RepID=A0A3M6QVY0_9BURK|nr:hypothetical protein [Corticibacter populi]RMX06739.1 hypothetical protein D8I35_09565 [Corticibacter populi]RZS31678.1 hypothetical protein EV687_2347 [Corticibacter populi]